MIRARVVNGKGAVVRDERETAIRVVGTLHDLAVQIERDGAAQRYHVRDIRDINIFQHLDRCGSGLVRRRERFHQRLVLVGRRTTIGNDLSHR